MSAQVMSAHGVRKAVIPAAGLGTRFLPATKATPKEMLPVVDKPAIQYVVEEAVQAGLNDVLFITGRAKYGLEDHFDRRPDLEALLEKKGDHARLELVRNIAHLADIHYVRQGEALGLGHAVLTSWGHVGNEPFAVLLGDDLIDEHDQVLPQMLDVRAKFGGTVLCLMEVPQEQISLYGCAAVAASDDPNVVRITDLVEKPSADKAPSNYAVIGRYILDPAIYPALEKTTPGSGGEIQLTDAIRTLDNVHGVIFRGRRYDTGDKLSYLKAVVRIASERSDLGPDFNAWLKTFVERLP